MFANSSEPRTADTNLGPATLWIPELLWHSINAYTETSMRSNDPRVTSKRGECHRTKQRKQPYQFSRRRRVGWLVDNATYGWTTLVRSTTSLEFGLSE